MGQTHEITRTPTEVRQRADLEARRGALRRDIAIWLARSVPDGTSAAIGARSSSR